MNGWVLWLPAAGTAGAWVGCLGLCMAHAPPQPLRADLLLPLADLAVNWLAGRIVGWALGLAADVQQWRRGLGVVRGA